MYMCMCEEIVRKRANMDVCVHACMCVCVCVCVCACEWQEGCNITYNKMINIHT